MLNIITYDDKIASRLYKHDAYIIFFFILVICARRGFNFDFKFLINNIKALVKGFLSEDVHKRLGFFGSFEMNLSMVFVL